MKSELLIDTLAKFFEIKRPVFISGQPGVGKTTGVAAMAKRMGAHYNHIHAATCLTEDFGMPYLTQDADKFGYKKPHWWPGEESPELHNQEMCFDDMSQCSADIQKVIANIIQ